MSDKLIRAASRTIDVRVAMPWLAAAGVYLLLTTFGYRLLADPDTYTHIALGRWILEHHAVPTSDSLSLTMRGTDWVAHEWLSQVAYAVAYALGGWAAVTALAAGAVATAVGLLARFLLREWQPIPTLGALLAGLVLVSPHILARPHVLVLPLMVAWIGTLIGALDDERSPPWRLLPLMVLWANLHGSFTFGLAMLGPIACEALWRAQRAERAKVAQRWVAFAALSLAAACLNPYGPEMIVVTYRTVALGARLLRLRPLPRRDGTAATDTDAFRGPASRPGAIAPCRSARIACAAIPRSPACRAVWRSRGEPYAGGYARHGVGRCHCRPVARCHRNSDGMAQ